MSGRKVCSLRDGETIQVTREGLECVIKDAFDAGDAAGRGVVRYFDPVISERTCHGTEYVSGEPAEYDCDDVTYYCSGCGYGCSIYVTTEDGSTYAEAPRFCPHCGARVVSE